MDSGQVSSAHSGPSTWAPGATQHGRLQYWVDMANGPGFNVANLGSREHCANTSGNCEADSPGTNEQRPHAIAGNLSSISNVPPLDHLEPVAESPSFSFWQAPEPAWGVGSLTPGTVVSTTGNDQNSSDETQLRLQRRSGRLQQAEDGHDRFFGASSNLHLIHNGPYSTFHPRFRDVQAEGLITIKSARVEWSGDPDFENHLRDCYFTWVNPLLNVVDQVSFERVKHGLPSPEDPTVYSQALENAM